MSQKFTRFKGVGTKKSSSVPSGIVADWRFNTGVSKVLYDQSIYGINLNASSGNSSTIKNGPHGPAYDLAGGTAHFSSSAWPRSIKATSMSVSAWININTVTTGSTNYYTIFDYSDSESNYSGFKFGYYSNSSGVCYLFAEGRFGGFNKIELKNATAFSIPQSQWVLVSVTYDEYVQEYRLYINGDKEEIIVGNFSALSYKYDVISIPPETFYADDVYVGNSISLNSGLQIPIESVTVFNRALLPVEHGLLFAKPYSYEDKINDAPIVLAGTTTVSIDEFASGGARLGGNSVITTSDSESMSGGANLAGTAIISLRHNFVATSGARTGGTSLPSEVSSFTATGGARTNGTSTDQVVDNVVASGGIRLNGNVIDLIVDNMTASGGVTVSGSISLGSANITIIIDSAGLKASGTSLDQAVNNITSTGRIVLSGTPLVSQVSNLLTTGGIVSSGASSLQVVNNIISLSGIVLNGTSIIKAIYSQSSIGGILLGGFSTNLAINNLSISGGIATSGTTIAVFVYNITPTGGAKLDSTARTTFSDLILMSGGALVDGSAIFRVRSRFVASGGVRLSGDAFNQVTDNVTATSGLVVSGTAINSVVDEVVGRGGLLAAGAVNHFVIYNVVASKGSHTNGSAINSVTNSLIGSGGVTLNGSAKQTLFDVRDTSGGIVIAGTTETSMVFNLDATDGVTINGAASITFFDLEDMSGGVFCKGNSHVDKVTGGLSDVSYGTMINGSADIAVIYNVFALGGVVVNGVPTIYKISDIISISSVSLNGTSDLFAIYEIAARNGILLSGTGNQVFNDIEAMNGGAKTSGTATQTFRDIETMSGGVSSTGNAIVSATYNVISIDGAQASGNVTQSIIDNSLMTGGLGVSGTSDASATYAIEIAGGISLSGISLPQIQINVSALGGVATSGGDGAFLVYTPAINGGSKVSGVVSQNQIQPYVGNGVITVSGFAVSQATYRPLISGGAFSSGQAVISEFTINEITMSGGVICSGIAEEKYTPASAGVFVGGNAALQTIYYHISSGGSIVSGGFFTRIYTEVSAGGAKCSGISEISRAKIYNTVGSCPIAVKCGYKNDHQFCGVSDLVQGFGSKLQNKQKSDVSALCINQSQEPVPCFGTIAYLPAITFCRQKIRIKPEDLPPNTVFEPAPPKPQVRPNKIGMMMLPAFRLDELWVKDLSSQNTPQMAELKKIKVSTNPKPIEPKESPVVRAPREKIEIKKTALRHLRNIDEKNCSNNTPEMAELKKIEMPTSAKTQKSKENLKNNKPRTEVKKAATRQSRNTDNLVSSNNTPEMAQLKKLDVPMTAKIKQSKEINKITSNQDVKKIDKKNAKDKSEFVTNNSPEMAALKNLIKNNKSLEKEKDVKSTPKMLAQPNQEHKRHSKAPKIKTVQGAF